MVRIAFTKHAEERIAARKISREAVEEVLEKPMWTDRDPIDPTLTRAFGRPEGMRYMIKVVFRAIENGDFLVVTAHFDRNAARKDRR